MIFLLWIPFTRRRVNSSEGRHLNQDFHFGYPGTGTVANPELRCNGFCLPVAFNPPFTPARASNAARRSRSGSPEGMRRYRSDVALRQLPNSGRSARGALASRHR